MSPKLFNILLVMIPVVLYYGYIDPMYNGTPGLVYTFEKTIPILKVDNVQYINSISQVDLIQEAATNLNKDYKAIDPKLIERVNTLLPSSIDQVKLRNDIVTIASNSGVALTNLQVNVDQLQQVYRVNFSMKARYSQFKTFMANYEKSTHVFILTNMGITHSEASNINENDGQGDSEKLSITVSSKVYFKK